MNREDTVQLKAILDELRKEFPPEFVKSREGSAKKNPQTGQWEKQSFKYIATKHVIDRLDEVFPLSWDWTNLDSKSYSVTKDKKIYENKKQVGVDSTVEEHLAVLGRLSLTLPSGHRVCRDAWGGSELNKGSQAADAFKIASSNAFKKAALNFGIGHYLIPDGLDDDDKTDRIERHQFKKTHTPSVEVSDVADRRVSSNPFRKSR